MTASIKVDTPPDVKFTGVNIGKTFFTRVTLYLEKTESIKKLAAECRQLYVTGGDLEQARKWAEESYVPHLSLVYAEGIPGEEVVRRIEAEVERAGIRFNEEAWKGGRIVLVGSMFMVLHVAVVRTADGGG